MYPLYFLILVAGIVELCIGFGQWYVNILAGQPLYRIDGSFENPGPYGGFLAIILPFALYVIINSKIIFFGKRKYLPILKLTLQLLAWSNFIGILIMLPLTVSRSAWLAALVGCICVIRPLKVKKWLGSFHPNFRFFLLLIFTFITLFGGIITYKMKVNSADGRLLIWKISLLSSTDHWLTGNGWGTFPYIYGKAQAHYFSEKVRSEYEQSIAGSPEYCFNEYIQITLEQGIIGLLLFGGITYIAFRNLHKSAIQEALAFKGALCSILIFAFFSYPFRVCHLCLLIIFIFMVAICWPISKSLRTRCYKVCMNLILLCILVTTCYRFEIIGHQTTKQARKVWQKLQPCFYRGEFNDIVNNYTLLYPYLSHDKVFLFEYGQCLSQTGAYQKSNHILEFGTKLSNDPIFYNIMGKNYQAMGQYGKAEFMFKQAIARIPHKLYPHYLLMNLYIETGQLTKAKETALYITNKNVKVISDFSDSIKNRAKQILYNDIP